MSSSSLLTEDGIRQLNNEISLLDNTEFKKVQTTKSTFAGAHIYINYSSLSKLLSQNTKLSKSNEKWISRWANWAELDLESSENNLTLSGFTLVEDSSSNYLTSLFDQLETKIEVSKVAPRNTYKITALGIEDYNLFYSNYKDFLAKHNNLYEHNKAITTINSKYNLDIEKYTNNIVLNEMGTISTFFIQENQMILYLSNPKKNLKNYLNISILPLIMNHLKKIIEDLKYPNLKLMMLLQSLYGHLFSSVKENYFSYIGGYLIFANSTSSLKAFINNFIIKKGTR